MTAKIPPSPTAVRIILKQLGLKKALANGRFSDEMFEWFLALLRDTNTLRNGQLASPKLITLFRGQDPHTILTSEVIECITTPCLFLWGDEDPIGSEHIAGPFTAQFPDANLEMVPGAGHAPWIDEPELCARRIRQFFA